MIITWVVVSTGDTGNLYGREIMKIKTLHHVVLLLGLTTSCVASALTVNFDDIAGVGVPAIVDGYAGLDWTGMFTVDSTTYPYDSGYVWGNVSPNRSAFTAALVPTGFASATDFSLASVWLTAAWLDDLNVHVEGLDDGSVVYSTDLVVDVYSPTLFDFGWNSIDQVVFTTSGGVSVGLRSNGPQLVMDDLTLTPVPEPEAWAMLLAGLGTIGLAVRRRARG